MQSLTIETGHMTPFSATSIPGHAEDRLAIQRLEGGLIEVGLEPLLTEEVALRLAHLAEERQLRCYGGHILYYKLAGRRTGDRFWGNSDGFFLLSGTHSLFNDQGNKPRILIIRPDGKKLYDLCGRLGSAAAIAGTNLIFKNIDAALFAQLGSHSGFRGYSINESWSANARFDDQTFPDVTIDLSETPASPCLTESVRFDEVLLPRSESRPIPGMKRLLAEWLYWYRRRYPHWRAEEVAAIYRAALSPETLRMMEISFGAWHEGNLAGFCVGSQVSSEQVDLWVLLTQDRPRNLSKNFYLWILRRLRNAGFRYVGLGGSEEAGLHRFKLNLHRPLVEQRMHMLLDHVSAVDRGWGTASAHVIAQSTF